jgi:hypothetical protein
VSAIATATMTMIVATTTMIMTMMMAKKLVLHWLVLPSAQLSPGRSCPIRTRTAIADSAVINDREMGGESACLFHGFARIRWNHCAEGQLFRQSAI